MLEHRGRDLREGDPPALGLGEAACVFLFFFFERKRRRVEKKEKKKQRRSTIDDRDLFFFPFPPLVIQFPSPPLTFAREHVLDRVGHARGVVVDDELGAVGRDERDGRVVFAF